MCSSIYYVHVSFWWFEDTYSLSARSITHTFCVVLNSVLNPKVIVETRVINLCPLGPHQRQIYNHRPLHYMCVYLCVPLYFFIQYKKENGNIYSSALSLYALTYPDSSIIITKASSQWLSGSHLYSSRRRLTCFSYECWEDRQWWLHKL